MMHGQQNVKLIPYSVESM